MKPYATLLAALMLALTSCGDGNDKPESADKPAAQATPEPRSAATVPPAPEPEAIEMTLDAGARKTTVRVAIKSLAFDGTFLTLNGSVECVKGNASTETAETGCSMQTLFSDQNEYWDFSGIRLLDRGSQIAYRPISAPEESAEGAWSSTTDSMDLELWRHDLEPGQTQRFWVRFAAPKAGVKALDVLFPNGGPTVLDQEITEGGVDDSPLPKGWVLGKARSDVPLDTTDTSGLKLNADKLTAEVTSRRSRTIQTDGRRTITLVADVLFDFDKATLDAEGKREVATAGEDAKANAEGQVAVDGYTDSKGTDEYNKRLSEQRAKTVADRLEGLDVKVTGHGAADAVAPNTKDGEDNPKGRAKNRRVTIGYAVRKPDLAQTQPDAPATPAQDTPGLPSPVVYAPWEEDDNNTRFRVYAQPLLRLGSLALAHLDITCLQSEEDDCYGQFAFAEEDGIQALRQGGGTYWTASGVRFFDPQSRSTYEPAYDASGLQLTGNTKFSVGRTTQVWAYIIAPPPSVKAMTLTLPNGGPDLKNVPVR